MKTKLKDVPVGGKFVFKGDVYSFSSFKGKCKNHLWVTCLEDDSDCLLLKDEKVVTLEQLNRQKEALRKLRWELLHYVLSWARSDSHNGFRSKLNGTFKDKHQHRLSQYLKMRQVKL